MAGALERQYNAILLDIEGTTTSISFVKDVLFPFVRKEVKPFMSSNWGMSELEDVIKSLRLQNDSDIENGITDKEILRHGTEEDLIDSLVSNVLWQMDNDRKTGAMKRLQGLIYRDAYEHGLLSGHVYDDVPPALQSWVKLGKKVFIYSSGSVEAQKLLYVHSTHGNLCNLISGYFDTAIGAKGDSNSYREISVKIATKPDSILFLTDIPNEAHAAKEAGFQAILSIRDGNAAIPEKDLDVFETIRSFAELFRDSESQLYCQYEKLLREKIKE